MIVIRENTEGEYANVGGFQYRGFPEEVGIQTAVFTRQGCERVIRYAFELAERRNAKRRVTSITKSNAQGYGMVVWDDAFEAVAAGYPGIETNPCSSTLRAWSSYAGRGALTWSSGPTCSGTFLRT